MSRAVVITGVAGGIGLATAQLFRKNGWFVIGTDLSKLPDASSSVDCFIQADVSDPDAWVSIHQCVVSHVDCVHGLVNNAAVQVCKPLIETSPDEWDKVMSVNLKSAYLGIRELYPLMIGDGGAIANISSVHAVATSTQIAAYAASKGGLLAFTRAAALELAPQIRVNAVLPGAVDTGMLRDGLSRGHVQGSNSDELVAALGQKHVMGRVGQPSEIAEAVYFLIDSNRSSFMTGQALVVDGGATIRLSTE